MKSRQVEVSIVIVFYSKVKLLIDALSSILNSKTEVSYEIIVVDNSPSPKTLRQLKSEFPSVIIVRSPKNLGYGGGNNLGVTMASGKYIFILNPDVIVTNYCLDRLLTKLKRSTTAAAVSPTLLDLKGNHIHQIGSKILTPARGLVVLSIFNKLFPNNPISRDYWNFSPNGIEVLPGSAFLIKKYVFDEVGRFDENFFLFFEEMDLFKRIAEKGYTVFYVTEATIKHHWSLPRSKSSVVKKAFKQSRFYYFRKHYGIVPALFVEAFAKLSKTGIVTVVLLLILITFLTLWI